MKWHQEKKIPCTLADDEKELTFQLVTILRGNDLNVDDSFTMYAKIVSWRTKNKIDTILERPFPQMREIKLMVPHCFHGFTKTGRPLYIEKTGRQMVDLILKRISTNQFATYHIRFMEEMQRRALVKSKETGRRIKSNVILLDCEGLGFGHRKLIDWLKLQANIDSTYYAEVLGKMIIINAPKVFTVIWKLAKKYVPPETMHKIHIYGCDRKEWQPVLYSLIDRDQLPMEYGGTCRCGNQGPTPETQMKSAEQAKQATPCIPLYDPKKVKELILRKMKEEKAHQKQQAVKGKR